MVTLNDYLHLGSTVPKIISSFSNDLRHEAIISGDDVELQMSSFFMNYNKLLLDSRSITNQSNKLIEFYKYIVSSHPEYTYTFSGRLKSFYRAYLKYNRYIMNFISLYHNEHHDDEKSFPDADEINAYIFNRYRDICGYKFVINIPICHIDCDVEDPMALKAKLEEEFIYNIANKLPRFLEERNFDVLPASSLSDVADVKSSEDILLNKNVQKYYKNYLLNHNSRGYRALHISAHDLDGGSNLEIQLVSWSDDANNQLVSNHDLYEIEQKHRITMNSECMDCSYYVKAFKRTQRAYAIDFSKINIDMFTALSDSQISDCSGFLYPRMITPHEHLSVHQKL